MWVEKHIEKKSKNTVVCEIAVGYIGLDLEERSRKGIHLGPVSIGIVFKIMIVEKVKKAGKCRMRKKNSQVEPWGIIAIRG